MVLANTYLLVRISDLTWTVIVIFLWKLFQVVQTNFCKQNFVFCVCFQTLYCLSVFIFLVFCFQNFFFCFAVQKFNLLLHCLSAGTIEVWKLSIGNLVAILLDTMYGWFIVWCQFVSNTSRYNVSMIYCLMSVCQQYFLKWCKGDLLFDVGLVAILLDTMYRWFIVWCQFVSNTSWNDVKVIYCLMSVW
jgi:hypothetical protein